MSIRQTVDLNLDNLIKNIKKTRTLDGKIDLNLKFIKTVKELRVQNPTQLPGDEIYMDMIVGSLEEFPDAGHFKLDSCDDYKKKIVSQYDPRSGGKTKSPALNHAIDVLNSICAK